MQIAWGGGGSQSPTGRWVQVVGGLSSAPEPESLGGTPRGLLCHRFVTPPVASPVGILQRLAPPRPVPRCALFSFSFLDFFSFACAPFASTIMTRNRKTKGSRATEHAQTDLAHEHHRQSTSTSLPGRRQNALRGTLCEPKKRSKQHPAPANPSAPKPSRTPLPRDFGPRRAEARVRPPRNVSSPSACLLARQVVRGATPT